MRVRVKFVKTKMHTGRLMFCFFPGVLSAQTLTQAEYVHREIVDIASIEELTYELPFTANTPYLGTQQGSLFGSYGSFQILVVNSLQAPTTVANNIDLIIETAMGEGSEWFSPSSIPALYPVVPSASLSTTSAGPPVLHPNRPQSGGSPVAVITTLADAKVVGHQIETSQLCVGEKVLSLRQLIKVPASMANGYFFTTQSVNSGGFAPSVYFNANMFGASTGTGAGTAVATKDFLGLLAPYFRFNRGGMRVKGNIVCVPAAIGYGINPAGMGYLCSAARPSAPANTGLFGVDASGTQPSLVDVQPLNDGGMVRVLSPAWQTSTMVPNQYALTTSVPATGLALRSTSMWFKVAGAVSMGVYTNSVNYDLVRQPADDYELLMFIGPPKFTSAT